MTVLANREKKLLHIAALIANPMRLGPHDSYIWPYFDATDFPQIFFILCARKPCIYLIKGQSLPPKRES